MSQITNTETFTKITNILIHLDVVGSAPAVRVSEDGSQLYYQIECSDVFAWGCSDAERLGGEEDLKVLEDVVAGWKEVDESFINIEEFLVYYAAKRRGMRPQGAYFRYIESKFWPLFLSAGPEREVGGANPAAIPDSPIIKTYGSLNNVELVGYYGGDETHALSAWTSTVRDLTPDKQERLGQLLADLATNEHGTPFEKSMLHFLVTTEVASHIHLIKHRIGCSVNTESARYKELKEDKHYIPQDWPLEEQRYLDTYIRQGERSYHAALKRLTPLLGRKRAKESARFYLSYANQLVQDVSFNWRSFAHFQHLRNSEHAQKEIRDVADAMLQLVKGIPGDPFGRTIAAFGL